MSTSTVQSRSQKRFSSFSRLDPNSKFKVPYDSFRSRNLISIF
jgi:hypothetical protein